MLSVSDLKNPYLSYPENKDGRDFIIGDLHGSYDLLMKRLDFVKFDYESDRLFSVGDLIDRGSKSQACLELIYETWFYPVLGNHEDFMISTVLHMDAGRVWYDNGGLWSQEIDRDLLVHYCEELCKLPVAIDIQVAGGCIGVSHAQPSRNDWNYKEKPITNRDIPLLMWGRSYIQNAKLCAHIYHIKNIDLTIHGHTIIPTAMRINNSLFIDTGAHKRKFLTLLRIDNILSKPLPY